MLRMVRMLESAITFKTLPNSRRIVLTPQWTQRKGQTKQHYRSFFRLQAGELEREGVILRNNYTAERNSAYWDRRPVAVTARMLQIGTLFGWWYLRKWMNSDEESAAARLKDVFTSLGPAFVKIGQAASARPDFVPLTYLKQLEELQDRIPPFTNEEAFKVIETELKMPVNEIFSEISKEPVAAASLGQVYKARLAASGKNVAVKVQRPEVVEQLSLDVYLLRGYFGWVRKWRKVNTDLQLLIDEWATSLFKEVDYIREAANGARFKQLFGNMKGVYVPEMYFDLTTSKVLVMEWVDGQKLRTGTAAKEILTTKEDLRLVDVGIRCSLEQMLEEGFYHADPHPGNLLKLENGQLCYIDFGMMGQIDEKTQQALIRATLHLVNSEFASLAEDLIDLGMLPSESTRSEIVPALTGVFESVMSTGMGNLSFNDFSEELAKTMYQFKYRLPPYYTLLIRSMSVLEGVALSSDPSYKVLGAAYPWVARRLLSNNSPVLRQTLHNLLYKSGNFQFDRLEAILLEAVRSPGKAESFRSKDPSDDTLDVSARPLQFLLKEEGKFVREILLDEIAKGIDAAWRLSVDNLVNSTKSNVFSTFDGPFGGANPVLQLWKQMFSSVPSFSEERDRYQIAGLQRLSQALQQIEQRNETSPRSTLNTIAQASSALSWIVSEIQSLDPADREEALKIPMVLASKLSSRVLARAVRNTLGAINQSPRRELPTTSY